MSDADDTRERRTTGRAGRRRSATPAVSTIYWRDIPAQLTARSGAEQHKLLLHARFQHAIDRAAAVAGLTATNDYVQEWRSVAVPIEAGDIDTQLGRLGADVEANYPTDRLESIVANGGIDPASTADQPEESP